MTSFIRNWLRKLGRTNVIIILIFLSTISAFFANFFCAWLFGFEYVFIEDIILIISVSIFVTPLLSWYLVGLLFRIDEMEIKMTKLATIDSLTNTYNRGYFYQEVGQLLSNDFKSINLTDKLEHDYFPGFFIFDLDNFKPINDQYGHAAGDKVLASFGTILLDLTPASGVVARLGGDEFVVFLDKATQGTPQHFIEQILARVRSAKIEFDGNPISFAVSAGFSRIQGIDNHAVDMAMKAADNALYKVKRSGRNGFAMGHPFS